MFHVIQLSTQWTVENLQTNRSALLCWQKDKKGYMQSCRNAYAWQAAMWSNVIRLNFPSYRHGTHTQSIRKNCVPLKSNRTIYSLIRHHTQHAQHKYMLQLSPSLISRINLFERRIIILSFINSKFYSLRASWLALHWYGFFYSANEDFSIYVLKSSSISRFYHPKATFADHSNIASLHHRAISLKFRFICFL